MYAPPEAGKGKKMDDNITLDREAFRTLASKTRVDILKSLGKRRKMLAELSRQFGMSPSTIKEHMDNLARADLVVQIDDGHKWKYYELTPKGREITNPTGSRIMLILGISLIAAVFTAWDLTRSYFQSTAMYAARGIVGGGEAMEAAKDTLADNALQAPAAAPLLAPSIPVIHIMGLVVFTGIFGIALGYWLSRRTGPSWLE